MKKKILLVEDEKPLCLLYEEELSREGYDITAVTDAEAALDQLGRTAFDLIITDIILPGISGIELLTKYRKTNPRQKVIIITAYASLVTAVEAIKAEKSRL